MIKKSRRLEMIPPYLFAEIARTKAAAIAAGKDIVDLGIGDPDQPTPKPIIDELYKYALEGWTHRYDESPHGEPEFLAAASDWFQRAYGTQIDAASEIVALIGSKEGLAHLNWSLCDPGDLVIVPSPAYTVYAVSARMAGAEVYEAPLAASNGFLMDFDSIPSNVADRAKLLYICYPNNPTGATADLAYFQRALEFCEKHDIYLVNDAAYAQVCYDGFVHPSLLQVPGAKNRAVEFHSLSKMFNMTGWRAAFLVGNPEMVAALTQLKSNVDSKQFMAIMRAGAYALRNVSNQETFDLYQRRRDVLVGGLRRLGWNVPNPKATFYVWAPVPAGRDSMGFAKELLERADVLLIPGIGYGQHGEGFIRMSLTVSGDRNGDRMAEAVSRIERCGFRF